MSEDDAPRERRSDRQRRRAPGLASALAGAGLLVVLGFALGVVAGLVMEEPDLLLDYVTGRTREVEVVASEPALPVAPDVAASPPVQEAAPQPAAPEFEAGTEAEGTAAPEQAVAAPPEPRGASEPADAPEPATGPERPALAAVAPAGGFAVQVGAFAEAPAAEQLARRLRERGHPVYVAPSAAGSDTARWRVRVGPLGSRAEAEAIAARLEREERLSTWVLAESPL